MALHHRGTATALYRIFAADDRLLYVGVSINPTGRLKQHRYTQAWWPEAQKCEVQWHLSGREAYEAETEAIKTEHPKYNLTSTDAYRSRQSAIQRANAPTQRVKCKVAYEAHRLKLDTVRELTRQGMSRDAAEELGRSAERSFKEASGAFPGGVIYPAPPGEPSTSDSLDLQVWPFN
jgi:predicted GIY-YIG superfamily endonuclease